MDRRRESGIDLRRQLAGGAIAAVGLPALTALLTSFGSRLDLSDDLLIYLVLVVAAAGDRLVYWPGVFAAVAACLLLNWYFTEPVHTFTIAEPRNLLALVLFVTVAVAVSGVVHLAARREADASRSAGEPLPTRTGPDRPRRRGHADGRPRPPHRHARRPRGTAGAGRRQVDRGRVRRRARAEHEHDPVRGPPRASPSKSTGRPPPRRPRSSRGTPRRRWRHLTGPGCAPRPPRPRRWPRATGCGPRCSARSATTCEPRSPRSRRACRACGRPTSAGRTRTRRNCSPTSSRTPTGSTRWSATCST